jgi:hypothetical protein
MSAFYPLRTLEPTLLSTGHGHEMKQVRLCLLLLVAGCGQTLTETAGPALGSQRTLIGQVVSTESITVVATNGSLHQADVVRFTTDGRSTEEFVSIFACPLKDGRRYVVLLEATTYHFIAKRKAEAMPN